MLADVFAQSYSISPTALLLLLIHYTSILKHIVTLLREENGKRFVFMVHIQVKLNEVSIIYERGRIRWNITLQIILSKILLKKI